MDIKIDGVTEEILASPSIKQKKDAYIFLRLWMLSSLRPEVKSHQMPRVIQFNKVSKIREVIGRGGATIKDIIEKFSVSIDISDEGLVKLSSDEERKILSVQKHIEELFTMLSSARCMRARLLTFLTSGRRLRL